MTSRAVLVTGASRGLGLAICVRLLRDGFRVVATSRQESASLAELCRSSSGACEWTSFDLSKTDRIHEFCVSLHRRFGTFFGLVANAASGRAAVLATQHDREIEQLIQLNLLSPILLTKYLSRRMMVAGAGRVVLVSSVVAETGYRGLSVYGSSKAALVGFSRSLARELGPFGVTVNCVLPGFMSTDMTTGIDTADLERIRRRSALGALAGVQDAAAAVSYLLGEDGVRVTGTSIKVDAGATA